MQQQLMKEKYFKGRTLLIATKHEKEKVLKPFFEQHLGVHAVVPQNFDTDDFGTFSGEVEREHTALETARAKCDAAHTLTGETLILASEGSFGAHPVLGFIPADEEILLLKDYENDLEFKAKVLSTQTNFAGAYHFEWSQVLFFASQVNFPSHALIVRASKDDLTEMHKGITDWVKLKESYQYFERKNGKVYTETDMRAMHNPTRMKVIEQAAVKLLSVIEELCPVCEAPGFEAVKTIKGLPCNVCDAPTETAKAHVHVCSCCGYSEQRKTGEKKKEEAMFCDVCNP